MKCRSFDLIYSRSRCEVELATGCQSVANRTRFRSSALIVTVTVEALIASAAHCGWALPRRRWGIARPRQILIAAKLRRVDARPHIVVGRRRQFYPQLKVVSLRPAEIVLECDDLKAEAIRLAEIPNVTVAPAARI